MKSSFGNSRRFGFIGYKTDKDAKAAIAHFNNTFIDTSKIIVEKAKEIGDDSLPRAWSQHTLGTSANARRLGVEKQRAELAEAALKAKRERESNQELQRKQEHLSKLYQAENDPKLREYLEVMQPRAVSKTWANDDAVELNTEKVGHGRENNRTKARAQVVALKNRKPGGEGLMVTQTKITFDDSDDELYDNLPTTKPDEKSTEEDTDILMTDAIPTEDTLVNNNEVSDLDWLKSRMAKPAEEASEKPKSDDEADEKKDEETVPAPPPKIAQEPPNRPVIISAEEEEEQAKNLIADTGRLFVRNLAYTCTEDDLRKLFEKFGPLSEVHMPIAKDTKKPKGYAYVLFLLPEHAINAFSALDKKMFMGRLLHIIASKEKPQPKEDEENVLGPGGKPLSIKKQRELKKKGQSGMDFNWNSLYMNSDAIAASIADRLNVSKADILNPDADNMGVRLAVAETKIIMETKQFLEEEGINVDAFGKKERSDTVILVKNIPYSTTEEELQELFGSHGDLGRVLMPPAKTIAIVEFLQPSEARSAFSHLAYRRFKDTILYLEKAPVGVFQNKYDPEMKNKKAAKKADDEEEEALSKKVTSTQLMDATTTAEDAQDVDNMEGATLFVKNINFKTTDEGLRKAFAAIDGMKSTMIRHKPDAKNPGKTLSMGFGFVEFVSKEKAVAAMKAMNGFILDGSKLEIKFSDRGTKSENKTKARIAPKDHGTKLLIRNIPFEATKKDIQGLFSSFGQLKSVRIPKKMNGGHRGFAFLDFMTKQEAKSVYENVSSTHLLGRHLVVEWAEEDANLDVLREKVGRQFRKDDGHGSGKRQKIDLDGDNDDMMMEDD
ncbi:multiple RNA-binding domain-containing protein 1 [Entomortierella parvispora]|uniref:Multiple RNA-binding domain-containing protein 1 n=1 Tax=Entomortierella parvispora TaxID=205924 RepID=A0A9P3LSI0_9FUNG|nr:multiple RNA-binding domain-containing protein 1 [Entomortierella parvispora]